MSESRKVIITGANGFIGRALCAYLTERGWHTVALLRRTPETPLPVREVHVIGPFEAIQDFTPWCNNAYALIHAAGLAHQRAKWRMQPSPDPYLLINTQVTKRFAEAAITKGVAHFIFLSSIKAVTPRNQRLQQVSNHTARSAETAATDAYGRSKWAAEEALFGLAATHFIPTILRLPLVYGPGVKGNLAALCRAIQQGWPLPFGAVHNQRSLLGLDHLVACLLRLLEHPPTRPGCFFLADQTPISTPQIIQALAEGLGKNPRLFSLPRQLLTALLFSLGQATLTSRLCDSLVVDAELTYQTLGWKPHHTTWQGLVSLGQHFKHHQNHPEQ